jgi:hypothetical protein
MLISNVNISINSNNVLGLAKDESALNDLKVTTGTKVMVVGSTLNDEHTNIVMKQKLELI